MAFLNKCDELRILVLILPPHSTHRLQPLDVGVFQPLSTAYSKEVNNLLTKGLGFVSMKKRHFWTLFKPAYNASFTEANIQGAFAKAGIWPLKPNIVLDVITRPQRPTTPPEHQMDTSNRIPTPLTSKSIRALTLAAMKNPSPRKIDALSRSCTNLSTQHAIDKHTKQGLFEALNMEKKSHVRGRKLNLLGKEDNNAQLYSPTPVSYTHLRAHET